MGVIKVTPDTASLISACDMLDDMKVSVTRENHVMAKSIVAMATVQTASSVLVKKVYIFATVSGYN